ncbi:MAG: hypothetical protein ACFFBZ_12670 [Promethearchaeota archaeon]
MMELKRVKIQVVFIGKPQWEGGWPHIGYDNDSCMKIIQNHLLKKFSNIEFVWSDLITYYNQELIRNIKGDILTTDGIIIFTIGHYGDPGIIQAGIEIIESKKPVILANLIYMGDHTFTKIYATVKDKDYQIYFLSSRNLEDFDKPFENMFNLLRISGKKILAYASDSIKMNWEGVLELIKPERKRLAKDYSEFINEVEKMSKDKQFEFYTDIVGLDQAHQWRKDENLYKQNLKEVFGIEMVRGAPDEILKYYDDANDEDAKIVAEKWINNALEVETSEKAIINSAKLYLALKKLLMEKNIDVITPDCGTFLLTGKLPAFPCLAFMELINDGIYGICESDMDSTVSYLFGLYLTGRPGFVSNHTLDTFKNQITYMHCYSPTKLYGIEESSVDYEIVYHGESYYLGACPCVKFPIGESVTTIKISILEKKISIRTGKIINNIKDKKGCVSKMLVESNVKKIMDNYDWETFGWHRVTFIGDWKQDFIFGAKMLGLKIIVEDE